MENDYCLLLALPCGRDQEDVLGQTQALKSGFITYLQAKQAAGIINVPNPGSNQVCARQDISVHSLFSHFFVLVCEKNVAVKTQTCLLPCAHLANKVDCRSDCDSQPAYVVQIFPPCEFSESHLSRLAPDLLNSISSISPHLMIVIAAV